MSAWPILSLMVFTPWAGALILARAVSDERLSNRILEAMAKRVISHAGGESDVRSSQTSTQNQDISQREVKRARRRLK